MQSNFNDESSKKQEALNQGDAGTYPSRQRRCAATASQSGEMKGEASPPIERAAKVVIGRSLCGTPTSLH